MRRALTVLLAGAALAGLAVAPVQAQTGQCQAPTVSVGGPDDPFEPGESRAVPVTVGNPNDAPATATLEVVLPEGWSGDETEEVEVDAGAEADADVDVVAPEEDGVGGNLEVTATLECNFTLFQEESEATTASAELGYQPPGLLGGSLPWVWVAVGALAVVAGGGGIAAYRGRSRPLEVDCPRPVQEAPPGGRASFEVAVENPRDAPDTASIVVRDPPPGWKAFATVDAVEVGPGEVRTPTVVVVVPDEAGADGSARFAVDVTSERTGEAETVPVRVDVVDRGEAPGGAPNETGPGGDDGPGGAGPDAGGEPADEDPEDRGGPDRAPSDPVDDGE